MRRCFALTRAPSWPPGRCWRRSRTTRPSGRRESWRSWRSRRRSRATCARWRAACRLGGAKRVKVETVERLCRKVLGTDPRSLYGDSTRRGSTGQAGQRAGAGLRPLLQLAQERVAAGRRRQPPVPPAAGRGRAEALLVAIGYLERHGLGVRRDHNGTDRYQATGGLVAVAFEHRMSRSGDPNLHTHVLVQNAAQGPDGRWTALDSDRLYAQLMAADHLYLAAERAALTERLGVRWGPVDARSGAAEIRAWTTGH